MRVKNIIIAIISIILILIIIAISINEYVIKSTEKNIITEEEAKQKGKFDCILILGAGVWGDTPSPMLEDRLLEGIELYKSGVSNKIIMSGDHSKDNYDEVNVMKKYAEDRGVSSEDIFMDHAGLSTYESMYRAKNIFEVNSMLIVTQKYHLYRSIYIAKSFGIEAYGVQSNPRDYEGQFARDVREIGARDKDFLKCIIKPNPTYLGDTIPVSGNGDTTNDK